MRSNQISCVLKKDKFTKDVFLGCFPIDRLPQIKNGRRRGDIAFIVNSDPHNKPGQHWLAVYISSTVVVFFDSLAQPAWTYSTKLESIIRRQNNRKVWTVGIPLQSVYSNLCGQYCVFAIQTMARTGRPIDILRPFTVNTLANDRLMMRRFHQLIRRFSNCNLRRSQAQISTKPIAFI